MGSGRGSKDTESTSAKGITPPRAYLRDFTGRLTQDLGLNPQSDEPNAAAELAASGQLQEYTHLLARCYYKLGEWQSMLQPDWGSVSEETVPAEVGLFWLTNATSSPPGIRQRHTHILPFRHESRQEMVQGVALVGVGQLGSRGVLHPRRATARLARASAAGNFLWPHRPCCSGLLPVYRPLPWQFPPGHAQTAHSLVQVRVSPGSGRRNLRRLRKR